MSTLTNIQAPPIAEEQVSYFQQRMAAMRISKMPTIKVLAPEEDGANVPEVYRTFPAFEPDTHGNILINYWNIDGELFQRQKERSEKAKMGGFKIETYQRIRYAEPKGDKKYMPTSQGWGSMPYFPIQLVEAYKQGKKIKALFITEGEFKAHLGCEYGMMTIGIPGIHVIHDGKEGDGKLFHDIPRIIEACGVENVIILWDRDCRYCSMKDIENTTDATRRPRQFQTAALNLRNHLKDYNVDVYFSAITSPMFSEAKGLDDLLLAASHEEALLIAESAQKYDGSPSHFFRTNITTKQGDFYDFFALSSPDRFYTNNEERIGYSRFLFGKDQIYKYDEGEGGCVMEALAKLPRGVDPADFIKYGFYEYAGKYWVIEKNVHKDITNFTMKIKFFIRNSKKDSKRIVEVRNCNGNISLIEMSISDLISVEKFETKLQNADSLIYKGLKSHLNNLKEKLFHEEIMLQEVPNLGYVKKKAFWAWGNGITDTEGKFHEPDEFGIVEIDSAKYYLAAASSENKDEDEAYQTERKFAFKQSEANLDTWMSLMYKTFGVNGAIGTAFSIISIYRDIILQHDKLPLLFCFGKRGTGKSVFMKSLMYLYGEPLETISLGGKSTPKGMMRMLSKISNGLVMFDEYKNTMDKAMDKIELMKSTHDGYGNIQSQFTNDNKTQSNTPKSNAIAGGQEIPLIDPAFISRTIFLQFKNSKFQDSKEAYEALKKLQDASLTPIVAELFGKREEYAKKFAELYPLFVNEYTKRSSNYDVIDRQIKCWAMLSATVLALGELGHQLPFTPTQFKEWAYQGMMEQRGVSESSNEVKGFWDVIVYLIFNHELVQGKDYLYDGKAIYLRLVTAFPKYMEYHKKWYNVPGMGKEILLEYFKSEPTFEGTHNKRFKNIVTTCLKFNTDEIKKVYSIDLPASIPASGDAVTIDDTSDEE